MLAYFCNKCGAEMSESTFENRCTATVSLNGPVTLGEDNSDIHLCSNCTRSFKKWVSGESFLIGESEPDDNHSEFAF